MSPSSALTELQHTEYIETSYTAYSTPGKRTALLRSLGLISLEPSILHSKTIIHNCGAVSHSGEVFHLWLYVFLL